MPKHLTPKQERFCQEYIKTGNGAEAYRTVYDNKGGNLTTSKNEAADLLQKPAIRERIDELQGESAVLAKTTVADLVKELEEARTQAKIEGSPAAMVAATMGKAKLLGLDKGGDVGEEEAAPVNITVSVIDARRPEA